MVGIAFQEAPTSDGSDKFSIAGSDLTANRDNVGAAFDLPAFEGAVVDVHQLGGFRERACVVGVIDDKVGICAELDGTFAGIQSKDLGGLGACGVDKTVQVDLSRLDAVGVKQIDAIFEGGDAVGDLGKVRFPHRLLPIEVKGSVVGGDGADELMADGVPQDRLVAFVAQRWGHHILGSLKLGQFSISFIEKKVLDQRFDPDVDTAILGLGGDLKGFIAAKVDDVDVCVVDLCESGEVVSSFGFDAGRAAVIMPLRADLALGDQFFLEFCNDHFVFAVSGGDHSQRLGEFEGVVEFFVIDAKGPFVGQKDLKRRDAVADDLAQLAFDAGIVAGDGHVVSVVTSGLTFAVGVPCVPCSEGFIAAHGDTEVDKGGRPSHQGCLTGRCIGVFGKCSHKREVDVCVWIDKTGEDIFSCCIDHGGIGRRGDIFFDACDGFAFTVDVGGVAFACGDDLAVLDQ